MNRRPEHLTVRQEEILPQIRRSTVDRGEALPVRGLGEAVGLRCTASVAFRLKNLEQSGVLGLPCFGTCSRAATDIRCQGVQPENQWHLPDQRHPSPTHPSTGSQGIRRPQHGMHTRPGL